ncbi:MAG: tRNA pseudouridine(55) synthase TruB [Thermodesulfobacteriota bacterium]
MHGILLVDKPEGVSSGLVVHIVKNRVKPAKVGHSGTLDPAATGLMVVLVGAATRALDYLDEHRKAYSMTVLLGEETDTCDRDGTVISTEDPSGIVLADVERAVEKYRGVIDQVPPHFSAVKKDGVPLYKLARKGELVDLPPRKVEIFSLEVVGWEPPLLAMELVCSKGTYARSLARDLGRDLGVGARLEALRRTASGQFEVSQAATLEEVSQGGKDFIGPRLIDLPQALAHIPDLPAVPGQIRKLMSGNPVTVSRTGVPFPEQSPNRLARLFKVVGGDGAVVILVSLRPKGSDLALQPVRVLSTYQ